MITLASRRTAVALTLGLIVAGSVSNETDAAVTTAEVPWNDGAVRHLFNRAGFGLTPPEIDRFVQMGLDGTVDFLLSSKPSREAQFAETRDLVRRNLILPVPGDAGPEARRHSVNRVRERFENRMEDYEIWWVDRMLSHEEPLRDRMTLFWHGIMPSSKYTVRDPLEIIEQHQFVRENALGSVKDLLNGMARDGAMLRYLDNASNVKGHPNENWARELMELFSLGEGNYSEKDIQEAARAYTGWGRDNSGFGFHEDLHDYGVKTVLGVTGRLDGDHIVDIILDQPACGRYIAYRILLYLEGVDPDADRLDEYATYLADHDYQVEPMLRKLLTDPRFYRDEVVGTRIAGPIDFLMGMARRLDIKDAQRAILAGGVVLGQALFATPNVKGWAGGMTWINTATMIQRGNLAGVMLDQVRVGNLLEDPELAMAMASEGESIAQTKNRFQSSGYIALRKLQNTGWKPEVSVARVLRGVEGTDQSIVNGLASRLLSVEIGETLMAPLRARLQSLRESAGIAEGELLKDPASAEPIVRDIAQLILSLPEAQLN